ncbi:MAG: DUF692 domain-containing protein [Pyrinomonadaceae bacterium]|nr:DUF692 domain-containing protein [Pyrinomonadaceae bacterium]
MSPANMLQELSNLGIGIGFREPFRADLFIHRDKIDFLEITADHYFDANRKKLAELDLLNEHFPLIPHGLNLSLGSAEGIDENYLEKFAALVEKLNPAWFREHLCFTKSGGKQIGHLAPVPYTDEAVKVFVKNISHVKTRINTPLILENITYNVRFPSSEMTEAEFITRILEETDCGLLLDVTNLYINSVNFGFDWRKFLDELPLERIVQLHFVGLHKHQNLLIDAHAHKTGDEIWEVFREVCRRTDVKGAILERDENFPPFAEILEEMKTARSLFKNPNLKEFSAV